jgi:hypothetical protein
VHGHVHLIEGKTLEKREYLGNTCYPIPCTSFTSKTLIENNGFNIHVLGKFKDKRSFATLFWPISGKTFLDFAHIEKRYEFKIYKDRMF